MLLVTARPKPCLEGNLDENLPVLYTTLCCPVTTSSLVPMWLCSCLPACNSFSKNHINCFKNKASRLCSSTDFQKELFPEQTVGGEAMFSSRHRPSLGDCWLQVLHRRRGQRENNRQNKKTLNFPLGETADNEFRYWFSKITTSKPYFLIPWMLKLQFGGQ